MSQHPFSPLPAYQISVNRLVCMGCGAETNATCSCGKPYVPKRQRAEEIAEANPNISVRELAEQAKVSHGTAQEAKSRVQSRTPDMASTAGRDGKTYPAKKPKLPSYIPPYQDEPNQDDDFLDQIKHLFLQLTRGGQARCGVMLMKMTSPGGEAW